MKEKLVGLARELTPQQLEQARAMARKGPLADFPAGEGRPAIPKPANQITVHAISVRLPEGEGWRRRQVPLEGGGVLHESERDLPNGNRVQIHVADYDGPPMHRVAEIQMSGLDDTERLALFTQWVDPFLSTRKGRQKSEWVKTVRGPQRRFAAACKEKHEVREEAGEDGRPYLWQDWMFFCLDPVSHLLVQIDYAERYPAKGGKPSPGFSREAAAFFDSVEVDSSPGVLGLRPVAEVPAAIILVEDRLYSEADRDDHPAAVVFSMDPGVRLENLSALAGEISRLRKTKPRDPEEKGLAKYLTDGRPNFDVFVDVPRSMSPTHRAFVTFAMVRRRLLPGGHLHREGGQDSFLLKYRLCATSEHTYGLGQVGIVRPEK